MENVLSFYSSFFLLQGLLATIVGLFISHNILVLMQAFDCKKCLKIARLQVTKQRDFLLLLFCFGVNLACWMYFTGLFSEIFLPLYD